VINIVITLIIIFSLDQMLEKYKELKN